MTDYRPVDCRIYARYERAIVRGQRLRLRWRGNDGLDHFAVVSPVDLETCKGEEFLLASLEGGEPIRVRLDAIRHAEPMRKPDGEVPPPRR